MNTREFEHYTGCNFNDPDNCGACALTKPVEIEFGPNDYRMGINYSAWPLSYLQNGKKIPFMFMGYLVDELKSDNSSYVANLKKHLEAAGYDVEDIIRGVES